MEGCFPASQEHGPVHKVVDQPQAALVTPTPAGTLQPEAGLEAAAQHGAPEAKKNRSYCQICKVEIFGGALELLKHTQGARHCRRQVRLSVWPLNVSVREGARWCDVCGVDVRDEQRAWATHCAGAKHRRRLLHSADNVCQPCPMPGTLVDGAAMLPHGAPPSAVPLGALPAASVPRAGSMASLPPAPWTAYMSGVDSPRSSMDTLAPRGSLDVAAPPRNSLDMLRQHNSFDAMRPSFDSQRASMDTAHLTPHAVVPGAPGGLSQLDDALGALPDASLAMLPGGNATLEPMPGAAHIAHTAMSNTLALGAPQLALPPAGLDTAGHAAAAHAGVPLPGALSMQSAAALLDVMLHAQRATSAGDSAPLAPLAPMLQVSAQMQAAPDARSGMPMQWGVPSAGAPPPPPPLMPVPAPAMHHGFVPSVARGGASDGLAVAAQPAPAQPAAATTLTPEALALAAAAAGGSFMPWST